MSERSCMNQIAAGVLADYWLAALSPAEEEPVEEHLLSCDVCGDRLRNIIALAEAVRALARAGSLRVIVSQDFLERAVREGLRVRQYSPPAGGSVNCTVTPDDDLLFARLAADLSQAERVDLTYREGTEAQRLCDIPADRRAGEVILSTCIDRIRAAPAHVAVLQLIAVDSGGDRLLGEYTFNHSPFGAEKS